ncbi:hypothetical protein DXG01_010743 [Tephrocybe rancida]|nr:hypothetical protein DXG01_010743 [Tephrocybe rancida]
MLLENPWAGAKPQSSEQPELIVKLRTFASFSKKFVHGLDSYPYETLAGKPDQIPFFEMLGHGPPPKDVPGNPGDIYLDREASPRALYFRDNTGWNAWPGGIDGEASEALLATHPIIANRYLAKIFPEKALSWYTEATIRTAQLSSKRPARLVACQNSVEGFRFQTSVADSDIQFVQSEDDSEDKVTTKLEEIPVDLNSTSDVIKSAKHVLAYISHAKEAQALSKGKEKDSKAKLAKVQDELLKAEKQHQLAMEAQSKNTGRFEEPTTTD